jgi:hypothetical protein
VVKLLHSLDRTAYLERRRHLLALPTGCFLDQGDVAELCRVVTIGGRRAPKRTSSGDAPTSAALP